MRLAQRLVMGASAVALGILMMRGSRPPVYNLQKDIGTTVTLNFLETGHSYGIMSEEPFRAKISTGHMGTEQFDIFITDRQVYENTLMRLQNYGLVSVDIYGGETNCIDNLCIDRYHTHLSPNQPPYDFRKA